MKAQTAPMASRTAPERADIAVLTDETLEDFDPDERRGWKGMSLLFNRYEWTRIKQAAQLSNRTVTGMIRHGINTAVARTLGED